MLGLTSESPVDSTLFQRGREWQDRHRSLLRDSWRRVVLSLRFLHRLLRSGQRRRRWGLVTAVVRFRMKLQEAKDRVQTITVPVLPRQTTQMSEYSFGSTSSLADPAVTHVEFNMASMHSIKSPLSSLSPASRKKRKGATPLSAYYVDDEGHLVKVIKKW